MTPCMQRHVEALHPKMLISSTDVWVSLFESLLRTLKPQLGPQKHILSLQTFTRSENSCSLENKTPMKRSYNNDMSF